MYTLKIYKSTAGVHVHAVDVTGKAKRSITIPAYTYLGRARIFKDIKSVINLGPQISETGVNLVWAAIQTHYQDTETKES